MTPKELYEIWAPPRAIWSNWAKPVLFAHAEPEDIASLPGHAPSVVPLDWLEPSGLGTVVIADLPGDEGAWLGLALAHHGYRPVPLYNAIPAPTAKMPGQPPLPPNVAVVDVHPILAALWATCGELRSLNLRADAPPAFLLDANRRLGRVDQFGRLFDNRSVSLPTDFPSANLLLSRGLRRAILLQHGSDPQPDLGHTLLDWQRAGISILLKDVGVTEDPRPVQIARPSGFHLLMYNLLATLRLKRSPLGGFGGTPQTPGAG